MEEKRLDDHIKSDDRRFELIEQGLNEVKGDIRRIEDNHLHALQEGINLLGVEVAGIKSDVSWLKKTHWLVVSASVGSLLTLISGLVLFFLGKK